MLAGWSASSTLQAGVGRHCQRRIPAMLSSACCSRVTVVHLSSLFDHRCTQVMGLQRVLCLRALRLLAFLSHQPLRVSSKLLPDGVPTAAGGTSRTAPPAGIPDIALKVTSPADAHLCCSSSACRRSSCWRCCSTSLPMSAAFCCWVAPTALPAPVLGCGKVWPACSCLSCTHSQPGCAVWAKAGCFPAWTALHMPARSRAHPVVMHCRRMPTYSRRCLPHEDWREPAPGQV